MTQFRLQSVLNYRQRLEDQAQQKMAEAQAQRQRIQQQRDAHQSEVERLATVLAQRQLEGLSVTDLQLYQNRMDHQHALVEQLTQQLREAEQEVASCRAALIQASQDREAMDKLKQKDLHKQQQKERQRETTQLDEVGARGRLSHDE